MSIFDGEDAYGWIYRIERFFKVQGVEALEQLQVVELCLEGEALSWYCWSEGRSPFCSWKGLNRRLLNRFQQTQQGARERGVKGLNLIYRESVKSLSIPEGLNHAMILAVTIEENKGFDNGARGGGSYRSGGTTLNFSGYKNNTTSSTRTLLSTASTSNKGGICDNRDLSSIGEHLEEKEEEEEEEEEEEDEEEEEEEEKEESEKKGSKEASEMGSNSESSGYAASDNEVESDLESTARSEPKCKEMEDTLTDNVNNANANGGNGNGGNGGNGNGGNNGCSYKAFLALIENSGCAENQKVKYAASSFINKALTWWNTQVQARGHKAAMRMTWVEFKALLVEEFCQVTKWRSWRVSFGIILWLGLNHAG
ncbi:hypothetical protein Tco_1230296 [Tanacetum coccineum]